MTRKSRYLSAVCFTLTLVAAGTARAEKRLPADASLNASRAATTQAGDAAAWFPVSLEPAPTAEPAPIKPDGDSILSEPEPAGAPSAQQIQIPATVQHLRRADH